MKQLSTASHGWRSTRTIRASGNMRLTSGIRAMWSGCLSTTVRPARRGANFAQRLEIEIAGRARFVGQHLAEVRLRSERRFDWPREHRHAPRARGAREVHQQRVEEGRARAREADDEDRRGRRRIDVDRGPRRDPRGIDPRRGGRGRLAIGRAGLRGLARDRRRVHRFEGGEARSGCPTRSAISASNCSAADRIDRRRHLFGERQRLREFALAAQRPRAQESISALVDACASASATSAPSSSTRFRFSSSTPTRDRPG